MLRKPGWATPGRPGQEPADRLEGRSQGAPITLTQTRKMMTDATVTFKSLVRKPGQERSEKKLHRKLVTSLKFFIFRTEAGFIFKKRRRKERDKCQRGTTSVLQALTASSLASTKTHGLGAVLREGLAQALSKKIRSPRLRGGRPDLPNVRGGQPGTRAQLLLRDRHGGRGRGPGDARRTTASLVGPRATGVPRKQK